MKKILILVLLSMCFVGGCTAIEALWGGFTGKDVKTAKEAVAEAKVIKAEYNALIKEAEETGKEVDKEKLAKLIVKGFNPVEKIAGIITNPDNKQKSWWWILLYTVGAGASIYVGMHKTRKSWVGALIGKILGTKESTEAVKIKAAYEALLAKKK